MVKNYIKHLSCVHLVFMTMSPNILVMHVAFVLLYKLNKGFSLDARQRSLKIGLDVYKHSTKIKKLWYFYHNETTINSSLPLHIHDAITTCTSMIILSYLLLSFDLESRVGGQTGIKFQKKYKRFAYQLGFFYLPTSTTQDHPLSLGQSTSVPILLVLPTNY